MKRLLLIVLLLSGCGFVSDSKVPGLSFESEENEHEEAGLGYKNSSIVDNIIIYKSSEIPNPVFLTKWNNGNLKLSMNNTKFKEFTKHGYWPILPLFSYIKTDSVMIREYYEGYRYNRTSERFDNNWHREYYYEKHKKECYFSIKVELEAKEDEQKYLIENMYIIKDGKKHHPRLPADAKQDYCYDGWMAKETSEKIKWPLDMKNTNELTLVFPLTYEEVNNSELIVLKRNKGQKAPNKINIVEKEGTVSSRGIYFIMPFSAFNYVRKYTFSFVPGSAYGFRDPFLDENLLCKNNPKCSGILR